jgi:preprotein translocase subunit SecD
MDAEAGAGDRLTVHIAADERDEQRTLRKEGSDGGVLYLEPEPLIAEADIVSASESTDANGQPSLLLEISPDGATALRGASDEYLNRRLAFVWDDEVISAPYVRSRLASKLMITVGGEDRQEMLRDIAMAVNGRE